MFLSLPITTKMYKSRLSNLLISLLTAIWRDIYKPLQMTFRTFHAPPAAGTFRKHPHPHPPGDHTPHWCWTTLAGDHTPHWAGGLSHVRQVTSLFTSLLQTQTLAQGSHTHTSFHQSQHIIFAPIVAQSPPHQHSHPLIHTVTPSPTPHKCVASPCIDSPHPTTPTPTHPSTSPPSTPPHQYIGDPICPVTGSTWKVLMYWFQSSRRATTSGVDPRLTTFSPGGMG